MSSAGKKLALKRWFFSLAVV